MTPLTTYRLRVSSSLWLPLRHLLASLVKEELGGFRKDGRKPADSNVLALLEGYAYESEGEEWRLTAFGEGLRTLFGLLPQSLI
jgi:hypothetical protein